MKNKFLFILLVALFSIVAKLNAQVVYIQGEPKYNPSKSGMSRQLRDTSNGRWIDYVFDGNGNEWIAAGVIAQPTAPPMVSNPIAGVTVRYNKPGYVTWYNPVVNEKRNTGSAGVSWGLDSGSGVVNGITAGDTISLASDAQIAALEAKKLNAADTVGNFAKYYRAPVDTALLASDAQIVALENKKLNATDTINRNKILTRKAGDSLYVTPSVLAAQIAVDTANRFKILTRKAGDSLYQKAIVAGTFITPADTVGNFLKYYQSRVDTTLLASDAQIAALETKKLNAVDTVGNYVKYYQNSVDTSLLASDAQILALETKKLNAVDTVGNYLKYYQSRVDTTLLASDAQILALETKKLNATDTTGNFLKYYQNPVDTSLLASDAQILALETKKLNATDTTGNFLKYYQNPVDTSLLASDAQILALETKKLNIADTTVFAHDTQIAALETKKANEAAMMDSLNNKVDKYQLRINIRTNSNATDDYIPTEKAVRDAIQAINIAGNYMGSSNTFATLPTTSATIAVIQNGDWAILNATDGANCGGIYVYNGTSFQLGKCIDDISQLTNAQSLDKTDIFYGTTSGEQLYNASRAMYNERIQIDSANSRTFSNSLYTLKADTSAFAFDADVQALETKKLNAADTTGNYVKYYQAAVDTSALASDLDVQALETKKLNAADTTGNYVKYYQAAVDTSALASDLDVQALETKKLNASDTTGNYVKYYQAAVDTSALASDLDVQALETKKLNASDTTGNYVKYYQAAVDTAALASDLDVQALETKKLNASDTTGNYVKYYQAAVDTSALASDLDVQALETKKLNASDTTGYFALYYQTPTDTSLLNSKALTLAQLAYKADLSYVNGKDSVILTNTAPSVFVGRIVIDTLGTDTLYTWNDSQYDRFEAGGSVSAANGISVVSSVAELGGSLTKPTTITTTATNVLKLGGLQNGSAVDSILTIKGDTIKRAIASSVNLVGQITAFARITPPSGYLALSGQTITNGATLYPILANVYPNWVSGNNLVLPNYNSDVVAGQGGYFLRGLGTRTPGSMQQDTFEQHNHQSKDVTVNQLEYVLLQISNGGNTAPSSDATPGEPNIVNNTSKIPLEGGVETRPYNVAILWCVATDQVLISAAQATVSVTNEYTSFNQVYTQAVSPLTTPPATQNEGDIVVVTSDGTTSGTVLESWTHNGTAWQLQHQQAQYLLHSRYVASQSAAQTGIGVNTAISFPTTDNAGTKGTQITHPTATTFLLKAGGIYKLTANLGWVSVAGGYARFQWFNVTSNQLLFTPGHYETSASAATVGSGGLVTAFVEATADATVELRQVSPNTAITVGNVGNGNSFAYAIIEKVAGNSEYLPVGTITSKALHSARLRRTTAQSIPNSTSTPIQFTVQDDNPQNIGKLSQDDAIVIAQTGSYDINFRGGFDGAVGITATTALNWAVVKNGTPIANAQQNGAIANNNYSGGVSMENVPLVVGDILRFQISQNSGSAKNTSTSLFYQPTVELRQNATHVTALVQPLHTYIGIALSPNITPPIGTPADGDTYVSTSDGTKDGTLQNAWVYSSTEGVWVMTSQNATHLATTSDVRTYYPSTTALQERWGTGIVTAGNITAWGFTAVGAGASIVPNGSGALWNGYAMMNVSATEPVHTGTFTAPTSYVRHEIPITAGSDNAYFIQVINEIVRDPTIEVWICDPVTGVPLSSGRLYAQCTDAYDINANSQTYWRSPKNEVGLLDAYRQWYTWLLPKALIDANKTATNTIKLAIRPAFANGDANLVYVSGFAMAKADYGFNYTPYLQIHWNLNQTSANAANGGHTPTGWTTNAGIYTGYVPNAQNRTFRIPLPDTTKDIYLTTMGLYRPTDNTDGLEYTLHSSFFKIVHTSGDVDLGRPRLDVYAPSANQVEQGYRPMGWIVTKEVLKAKATTVANSAIPYLLINLNVPQWISNNGHFAGFITENVSSN
jgi:hypothetical protein